MAVTQNTYTGNGSTVLYSFTFPYLETTDVKVTVNGVITTAYTFANATTIQFNTAPLAGAAIRIYRQTDDSSLRATFYSGSAIRAQDLNDDFTQNLYSTQEVKSRYLDRQSGEMESTYVPTTSTSLITKGYMETNYGVIDEVGFTRWRLAATAGQTTFSGTGNYGGVLTYVPTREQVYINGALQQRSADYTADNGTSVVFSVGLTVGDVVDIICINNVVAGTANNAANITYSGQFSGQTARTVAAKLADVVSVKDFGAVGDGNASNATATTAAINTALAAAAGKTVYLPAGTYVINGTIVVPNNTALMGDGAASTIISAHPTLSANTTLIDISNKSNCMVAFLRVNGSKSTRGSGGGNNIMIRGSLNAVYSVSTIQAPNSGILIDGQTYAADINRISECSVEDNGGVGLSQHTARQTYITNNFFARNGLENLTVDNTSFGTIAVGNRFFRHGGGCGNVGWDDGDSSIFSSNYIDCESSLIPDADARNGFCVNAEAGVNDLAVISSNVIINCPDVGIWLRNRTGTGGFAAGSSAITGNIVRNSGSRDIRIGATSQQITLKANNYESLLVEDPETDVRVGSGEIGFEAGLAANQTFTLSSTFTEVNFNTPASSRLVTRTGNRYTLPAGGFYHLETKVRFTGLTAAGNPEISLRITYPGGSKVINSLTTGNYRELDMSLTRLMGKGDVYVEVRTFGGTGGTSVTLNTGSESYFTCVLVG